MAQADNPEDKLAAELDRTNRSATISHEQAHSIVKFAAAFDENAASPVYRDASGDVVTKSHNTLATYVQRLRRVQNEVPTLTTLTQERVERIICDLSTGEFISAPEGGYSDSAMAQFQSALKLFYKFHDDHEVDPEKIVVEKSNTTTFDERDLFDVEEVDEMREEMTHIRNECMLDLLAYTGQRIRVIQTLRVKDVDPEQGVFWINEGVDGLKGAKGKRPLLGADESVRAWLDEHPTGDPNDYLLTPLEGSGGTSQPGEMLSKGTIRYHLKKAAENAGVEKKVHAHSFRHFFTTVAKRDYEMDDSYIKHLRGDAEGSRVMETTYQHLSDEDAIDHANKKFR